MLKMGREGSEGQTKDEVWPEVDVQRLIEDELIEIFCVSTKLQHYQLLYYGFISLKINKAEPYQIRD